VWGAQKEKGNSPQRLLLVGSKPQEENGRKKLECLAAMMGLFP
jgi:hypothetical protein